METFCNYCGEVIYRYDDGFIAVQGAGRTPHICRTGSTLIQSNSDSVAKKTMNIVEKIKLSMKKEPAKSLIKAGILNEKEELTLDGRAVLEMLLVEEYKDKLKVQADIILEEEK